MISSEQLIALSKKGRDVRVAKDACDHRHVIIRDRTRRTEANVEVPPETYEGLMQDTVAKLVARNGADLHVSVGSDFYGRSWIEVRSGFLSRRKSRLGLSPRHVNMLRDALGACQQQQQAA